MIAAVIPFFLLANLTENEVWQNGPEFRFSSSVRVRADGFYENTVLEGLDITNQLICRPKDSESLYCEFKHLDFVISQYNKTSDVTSQRGLDESLSHVYQEIPFEIKFDNKGVKSIVLSKDATKDVRLDLIKSIANLMNVGVDLADVKLNSSDKPLILKRKLNFLLGFCDAEIGLTFSDHRTSRVRYNLNLIKPSEGLSNKELLLRKWRSHADCALELDFFWTGIILDDLRHDSELDVELLQDSMRVNSDEFHSVTHTQMKITKNNQDINIRESFELTLADIHPAEGNVGDIEDPVIITFDVIKDEDENSI